MLLVGIDTDRTKKTTADKPRITRFLSRSLYQAAKTDKNIAAVVLVARSSRSTISSIETTQPRNKHKSTSDASFLRILKR